jgi:hypothetical protein
MLIIMIIIIINVWYLLISPQEFLKELHHKIDVIDEERYDLENKVNKSTKEVYRNSLSLTPPKTWNPFHQ